MTHVQLQHEVRSFIVENFLYGIDNGDLKNAASLLATGLIDSTGVLELVSFVEKKYGIAVNDDELVPDNFDTIDNLSQFILRKAAAAPRRDIDTSCINISS